MQIIAYRPIGPTYALSVANTKHADVAIHAQTSENWQYAAFVNSGAVDIVVTMTPSGTATPGLVFPVDGTPTVPTSFLLHANSVGQPVVLQVPGEGFNLSAIGAAAGPTLLYVTPVGNM